MAALPAIAWLRRIARHEPIALGQFYCAGHAPVLAKAADAAAGQAPLLSGLLNGHNGTCRGWLCCRFFAPMLLSHVMIHPFWYCQKQVLVSDRCSFFLAEMAGFEPANEGVKVPCLTAWLHLRVRLIMLF